jgi:hypothetical protein
VYLARPRATRQRAWSLALLTWLGAGCADPVDERAARDAASADADDGSAPSDGSRDDGRTLDAALVDASAHDGAERRDAETADVILVESHDAGDDGRPQPIALSSLVETFFAPTCVLGRCHTTLAPTGDLSLTGRRVSVYDTLVNAPSRAAPMRVLVVPFRPEESYLIEKLVSEQPAAGTRMPPSGGIVPPEQLERLRAWIRAGAPNN